MSLVVKLNKAFPSGTTVDVDFSAKSGFTVLFGRSGAGKSVTLSAIAGLLRPDSGRIAIDQKVFFDSEQNVNLRPQQRNVGYVFQSYALFPHLSVTENINIGLRYARDDAGGSHLKVQEIMEELGISDLKGHYPRELSGGQQQRVALARAIVRRPDILLLDEPFSALDAPVRDRLRAMIRQTQKRHNLRVLLITHQPYEAYNLAEHLVVLDKGSVVQAGPPDAVFYAPATESVARLVGVKNIFKGEVLEAKDDVTRFKTNGLVFEAAGRSPAASPSVTPASTITWCIRPENIMILRKDRPLKQAVKENQLIGTVVEAEKHGPTWELLFLAESGLQLKIQLPSHAAEMMNLGRGEQVEVSLKKNSIHIIS